MALDKELEEIKKKFGFKPMSEFKQIQEDWDVLESGILPLDMASGDLGPDGRVGFRARTILEIAGYPNTGKSSVNAQFIKTTLDRYGEGSVAGLFSEPPDFNTFKDKGVDLDNVIARCCYDPDFETRKNMAEDWLEGMSSLMKLKRIKYLFIDSVSALMASTQLFEGNTNKEKEVDAKTVAALANSLNTFLARFLYQADSAVLSLVNHYKEQIFADPFQKMKRATMGSEDQYNTKGGTNIHYFARRRCMLKGFKQLEDKEARHSVEGTKSPDLIKINFDMYKRKDGAPRSTIGYLSMKDGSYNNEECLLDYACFFGTRQKDKSGNAVTISSLDPKVASSGAWFYIGDQKFNGKDNAIEYLKQNKDIYEKLKYQVYARHNEYFADELTASEVLDG